MTQPSTITQTPLVPTVPLQRDKAAPRELSLMTQQNTDPVQEAQNATQGALLPAEVQAQVNRFNAALASAQLAYDRLAKGYPAIWESTQYPVEFRQQKASEFMDAVFAQQMTDLDTASAALKAAWDAVKAGLTPSPLGDPMTHELKLLNARQDVLAQVADLNPVERLEALEEAFKDATEGRTDTGLAYLLSATDFYKRVIRDGFLRVEYEENQKDMLKKFHPLSVGYFACIPVLEKLDSALGLALAVRGFTAQDNGIRLTDSLVTPVAERASTPTATAPTVASAAPGVGAATI